MTGKDQGSKTGGLDAAAYPCRICDANGLRLIDAYRRLPRATSDSRPWPAGGELAVCEACGAIQKPPTPAWHDDAHRIYAGYNIYHLANGVEHPIFASDGTSQPRSRVLVNFLLDQGIDARAGRLIDIGCGNGAALANFAAALPNWQLFGSELSDNALHVLRRIRNFSRLFTGPLDEIDERFDLITMIHALEHMETPGQTLRETAALLNSGGRIFVEVPNIVTAPFDLLIADHMMHFTPAHLRQLAVRSGLRATIRDDVLPKEISMLAGPGHSSEAVVAPDPAFGIRLANDLVVWLENVMDAGREVAERAHASGRPFGIFGTSNSSMWLFAPLQDRVDFFADEDRMRFGAAYEGRTVFAPDKVPADALIFIPLAPPAANKIAERLGRGSVTYIAPPALPVSMTVP